MSKPSKSTSPELLLISRTLRALAELPHSARLRVIDYLSSAVHEMPGNQPPAVNDRVAPELFENN